jgi:hypothetical protein
MIKRPSRQTLVIGVLTAITLACCLYSALSTPMGYDYPGPICRGCDAAGPPIEALASGHVGRFFATQPFMGSVTLLLRVPPVAVARALGAGQLAQYRVGSLMCLLVAAGLAWAVVAMMRPRGRQWILVALLLGLLLSGPVTAKALQWGHPEELVGVVLCVLALALASRERVFLAGITLGLALATKQWAALAIPLVIIACPRRRGPLLATAAGVAGLFIVPMLLGDPSQFLAQNHQAAMPAINTDMFGVTATNIWFPYARLAGVTVHAGGTSMTYRIPPILGAIAHPLVIVLAVALPVVHWWRARSRSAADLMLVLALVFLLRCVLDPVTLSYHHLPFLVAIVCYEVVGRRRVPIISIYSAAAIWLLAQEVAPVSSASTLNLAYLAWALPLTAYLAYLIFRPAARPEMAVDRITARAGELAPETS